MVTMGLRADIYTNPTYRGCANGGLSEHFDKVTIVNVDGPSEPSVDAPAVSLEAGAFNTVVIRPLREAYPEGHVGPMMGGSYVATSDSRFREAIRRITGEDFYGAVPLHDRFETPAEYEALSR